MKQFTSLEQSKKLAEILPLESADMAWCNNSIKGINYTDEYSANLYTVKEMQECFDEALNGWDKYWELIPCWSLSALLELMPDKISINNESYYLSFTKKSVEFRGPITWDGQKAKSFEMDNILNAAFEMVCWLKENGKI